jgi:hypothetical protein
MSADYKRVMGEIIEGAACRPNFSAAGRRRRTRIAWILAAVTVALWAGLWVTGASWPLRLVVGLPAALCAVCGLQVVRNTCVAHAQTGRFENEDFSTTAVDAPFAEASRRVAATIYRDGAVVGLFTALVASASSFLR